MEIREYRKATRCERRGRWRRCRQPLAGQCQYCAKGFCPQHGKVQPDGQEICVDDRCQRLRLDVEQHLIFKQDARARNHDGGCGEPVCDQALAKLCDRCQCRFCFQHLRQVILTVNRGGELQAEAQLICDHCRARLPLWSDE